MATPVLTHLWVRLLSRWIVYASWLLLNMLAHQKPSLNQSLLSGFDVVGGPDVPAYPGPPKPAAPATVGSTSAATPQRTPQAKMPNLPLIPFLAFGR